MKVSLELQGWAGLDAAFRLAPEIVRQELLAAVTVADQLLEREVKDRTPDNVIGHLKDSYFAREQVLESGAIGVVGTPKPYAVYVELGTKPHPISKAGVESLEDWVRAKLRVPEKEVRGVAYVIARKIRQKGTQPVGMFSKTWAAQRSAVVAMFELARDRIAARMAEAAQ